MTKEEYNQLSIEEKALLMEFISSDKNFELISTLAIAKKLALVIAEKEKKDGKEKKSNA